MTQPPQGPPGQQTYPEGPYQPPGQYMPPGHNAPPQYQHLPPPQPWQRPRWFIPLIVAAAVLFVGMQITVGVLSFRHNWPLTGPFSNRVTITHVPLAVGSSGSIKNRNNQDVRLTIVDIMGNVPTGASGGSKEITVRVRFDLANTTGIVGDWTILGSDLQEHSAENKTFQQSTRNGSTTIETDAVFDVPAHATLKWLRFRVDLVADLYFDAP